MKTIITLLVIIAALTTGLATAQTIRRVNNTPGLNDPNVYATAQAAHNAAAIGDIISLEPSDSPNYGTLTITKRVTIVGPGYFLDKNPNTFFDKRVPTLSTVTFENGSANSVITGVNGSFLDIRDVNITVTRCRTNNIQMARSDVLVGGVFTNGNNATITNNFINGAIDGGANFVISNNIITDRLASSTGCVINYNTFLARIAVLNNVNNSTFTNNIIDARNQTVGYTVLNPTSTGNTVSNNVCLSVNGLPAGGGNVNGVNPSLVFINSGNPYSTYSTNGDADFQLSASSPARTAGSGGGQTGAFGGTTPYVLSGVPAYPVITSFVNSGAGNSSTPLTVTISVRSNN